MSVFVCLSLVSAVMASVAPERETQAREVYR